MSFKVLFQQVVSSPCKKTPQDVNSKISQTQNPNSKKDIYFIQIRIKKKKIRIFFIHEFLGLPFCLEETQP